MRAESRKKWDREKYLKAYKEKKPWPDPQEFEDYKIQRKLEVAPRNWDIKRRLEEAGVGIPLKTGKTEKSEHSEANTEDKKESHH